jgi:hypothetical protein
VKGVFQTLFRVLIPALAFFISSSLGAYVSGRAITIMIYVAVAIINTTHEVHLQDRFCAKKPPTRDPKTGAQKQAAV